MLDELYPNMWEVMTAGRIFKEEMKRRIREVKEGNMSVDTAIDISAVKVWEEARRYQSEKAKAKGSIRALLHR